MHEDPLAPQAGSDTPGGSLRRSLGQVLLVVVAIGVLGGVAGYLFGRADPQRAAGLLIRDLVETEPVGEATALPAPSSGEPSGPPVCGLVAEPLDLQTQVDSIAAGVVVVQFRDPGDADVMSTFAADNGTSAVVAPNPALEPRVMATAWGRRMRLSDPNLELLDAFVTANAGFGPQVQDCD